MAAPNLDQLYECATKLTSVKDFSKHEEDYKIILAGVKGDSQTKRLASQFIARFFTKFPQQGNDALDAILDLCEDENVDIRKQAIKDLPSLCKDMKEFLPKIADVLSQLLQTDDTNEIVVIQHSLMVLFRRDAKGTLIGLFSQVRNGGDVVRDRVLKFLHLKLKTDGKELLSSKESEAVLLEEIKNSIGECTADEFHLFMAMLSNTSLQKTVSGQAMIIELISKSCRIDSPFDPSDEEATDKIITCASVAVQFFSSQVKSTKFCEFICQKVLPSFDLLDSEVQTRVLKLLAEVCMFTGDLTDAKQAAASLYKRLMDIAPKNESGGEEMPAAADEATKFEFTKIESILIAFHTIGSQAPEFLTENDSALHKEFKTRLQYVALAMQAYTKKLDEFLKGKTKADLAKEENKVKVVAGRSANNISTICKDIFHSPPSYKSKIIVSWRPPTDKVAQAAGVKRKSISFADGKTGSAVPAKRASLEGQQRPKTARGARGGSASKNLRGRVGASGGSVYTPPTGKYSSNIGQVVDDDGVNEWSRQTRGGGGGRGGYRNRGGNFRGRNRKFR